MRRAQRANAPCAYQREAAGRALSVTFLADAQRAWVGFNALAVRAWGRALCYAGASTCSLEPALEREVQARLIGWCG
jgi:hypothetical protein